MPNGESQGKWERSRVKVGAPEGWEGPLKVEAVSCPARGAKESITCLHCPTRTRKIRRLISEFLNFISARNPVITGADVSSRA